MASDTASDPRFDLGEGTAWGGVRICRKHRSSGCPVVGCDECDDAIFCNENGRPAYRLAPDPLAGLRAVLAYAAELGAPISRIEANGYAITFAVALSFGAEVPVPDDDLGELKDGDEDEAEPDDPPADVFDAFADIMKLRRPSTANRQRDEDDES